MAISFYNPAGVRTSGGGYQLGIGSEAEDERNVRREDTQATRQATQFALRDIEAWPLLPGETRAQRAARVRGMFSGAIAPPAYVPPRGSAMAIPNLPAFMPPQTRVAGAANLSVRDPLSTVGTHAVGPMTTQAGLNPVSVNAFAPAPSPPPTSNAGFAPVQQSAFGTGNKTELPFWMKRRGF